MINSKLILAVSIFIVTLLPGCSSIEYISVPITKPAEVNMSQFKQIIVNDFIIKDKKITNNFTFDLITAIMNTKDFDVLDRKHLDKILFEHQLTMEGLTKNRNSNQQLNLFPAVALITGSFTANDYDEKIAIIDAARHSKIKKYKTRVRVGTVNVAINFQITDLTTSKILYTTSLSSHLMDSTIAIDQQPDEIDVKSLYKAAYHRITEEFVKKIHSYQMSIKAPFYKNTDDINFNTGLSYAKVGNWDDAEKSFVDAINQKNLDSANTAKAYYNLGQSRKFKYQFRPAEDAYKKAYLYSQNDDYLQALNDLKIFEKEYLILNEQK